mgnify:CR=1 FL=1
MSVDRAKSVRHAKYEILSEFVNAREWPQRAVRRLVPKDRKGKEDAIARRRFDKAFNDLAKQLMTQRARLKKYLPPDHVDFED